MNLDQHYTENAIRTYTGKALDLKHPTTEMFTIEDIAHGLANTARFGGQLQEFYTVAQHSTMITNFLPRHLKLAGLLHDAPEAFMGDIPSPFKKLMPEYRRLEDNLMQVIASKYDIKFPFDPQVKIADTQILDIEWDNLVIQPSGINVWTREHAKDSFLTMFYRLSKEERPMPWD